MTVSQGANEIRIEPNSKVQTAFFMSDEDEVLYGGAAGGGKSWALVVEPLRFIPYGDFTGIIFRRTYPELEGSIIPHCQRIYPYAGGEYNVQSKTWKFPSGATIRLGFMQYEGDWQNFAGHEYAYQGFDELTTYHEVQFSMLSVWNRSKAVGIKPYRRASSNPGNVGHAWVKRYFVDPCKPIPDGDQIFSKYANMWWQPMRPGKTFTYTVKETGNQITRRFIPARVFDNEDLLKNNPSYVDKLLQLPPHRRKALLEGDWDVFEGQFFADWKSDLHVIEPLTERIPQSFPIVIGLDYGQRTVAEAMYKDYEGNIVIFAENYTIHETPEDRAIALAQMILEKEIWPCTIIYDDTLEIKLGDYIGYNKAPIETYKEVFRQLLGERKPRMRKVAKRAVDNVRYRVVCNDVFKNHLRWKQDDNGKITLRPKLYVTRDCRHLIQTLPELIHDPESFRGLDFDQSQGEDDPFDAAKYGVMAISPPKPRSDSDDGEKPWYADMYRFQQQGARETPHPLDPFNV